MLELGAYWGHYSMWLKSVRPSATVYLVEPDELRLDSGKQNFERNNLQGNFVQAFVGKNQFDVDGFLDQNNIITLDILHADIQGYELEMLDGASSILSRYGAAYVFISTHSQLLHNSVIDRLKSIGYRIEVSADFDSETTSYDGFIFASRPDIDQVFSNWSPLGRLQLLNASPEIILDYITKTIRNI